ncbi:MAG: 23S rRNA (adenine(2503)-C(2))-methyltransferase RlmN, partial [Polyangiaceae bacterium]|nr:23S rRNA (adenine(2503)-C(2))-methyltransferase RlmN [Polyangiaceae bacterium]
INLIPVNPVSHHAWHPPAQQRVLAFQQELLSHNYTCLLRKRRGDDINAACGQLAGERGAR